MSNEVEALAEGFPTLLTNVRLLPIMNALVPDDVGAVDEGLPTVAALVRFLPRVNALVFHHIRIAFEAPVASAASVRLSFPVASPVGRGGCIQGDL